MNKPRTEESNDLSGRLRAKLRLEREGNSGTVWLDITFDDTLQKSICLGCSVIEFAESVFYGTWTDEDE